MLPSCRKEGFQPSFTYISLMLPSFIFTSESCSGVICPKNKLCVEDQYRIPHCISNAICKSTCDVKPDDEMLCGTNGVTYSSLCALRQVVCQHGVKERVGIAYKGACISMSSDDFNQWRRQPLGSGGDKTKIFRPRLFTARKRRFTTPI